MDQFQDFQQVVANRNDITRIALDCAAFVFRRASELPPHEQRQMLTLLTDLILDKQVQSDSVLK